MKTPTITRYTYSFAAFNIIFLLLTILVLVILFGWKSLLSQPFQLDSSIYTRIAINDELITAGFIFSISALVSVTFSLWPLLTTPSRTESKAMPLGVYLIVMFLTFVVTMGIATVIWFTTLRERTLVFPAWNEQLPVAAKRFIQDDLKCCGWFNATTAGLFDINELGTGFCANPDKLIPDPDPNVLIGCVDKLAGKVDFVLNTTFTSLYGFTGIELALFLTAACLANLRIQQKRFLRIDEKLRLNGKGGFV